MDKSVVIAGGSGLIGKRLTELLVAKNYSVTWLSRKTSDTSVKTFQWNPESHSISDNEWLKYKNLIILSGENIASHAWTDDYKNKIIDSRVAVAKTLRSALSTENHSITKVIAASAIGYYGDGGEKLFSEHDHEGKGFLSFTTKKWEDAYTDFPIDVTTFRIGVVLSKNGGALPELSFPMKFGTAPTLGTGKQMVSWIHLDDLCNMIIHTIENNITTGVYNAVGPQPVSHASFIACLRKTIAPWSIPFPVPSFILRLILKEKSAIVLDSTNVSSKKISSTGFKFTFPNLTSALKNIYGK